MAEKAEYFDYLKQRSKLGFFYRKYWLYPRLTRCLKGKALDIGCGIGDFLACRPNTLGVDINEKTVSWCQDLGYLVDLMEVDKLPYEEASFDSIMMDNVLEHIVDPKPILNEINRVLLSGGTLIVGVPGSLGYQRDPDHKVFYSKETLVNTLKNAGFVDEKVFAMPLDFDWLETRLTQYCIYGVFKKK
ncbi:MAG: SAM-dependent methyltransferase [Psychroserpens sp.]|jgi:SAM-dependent methyltransferase